MFIIQHTRHEIAMDAPGCVVETNDFVGPFPTEREALVYSVILSDIEGYCAVYPLRSAPIA